MRTISNFKRIVMGVAAIALSIGLSSYMQASKEVAQGPIYVNRSGQDYSLLSGGLNLSACISSNELQCAWQVTAAGAGNVTGPFDAEQAEEYFENGWISPLGSQGVYDDEE